MVYTIMHKPLYTLNEQDFFIAHLYIYIKHRFLMNHDKHLGTETHVLNHAVIPLHVNKPLVILSEKNTTSSWQTATGIKRETTPFQQCWM